MALKIVTGGTTGLANGTLVSSSNKIVFAALDTAVDCHIRSDDDTYSADTTFSMPSDGAVQVSFDGGSTWKAFSDNPASYGVDIGDLNVAIKLRQHANATASTGTFQTDATTPAATTLADVTGFTVTPGTSQNALSWSAVTNRSFYQIDRATNSGFTTGVALDISPGLTTTSLTDTGLTAGTTYYYRIKAIGRVRYKDSANYATGNGTPTSQTLYRDDLFTDSDGVILSSHTPTGSAPGGTWSKQYNNSVTEHNAYIKGNRANIATTGATGNPGTVEYWLSGSSNNNCASEVDAVLNNSPTGTDYVMVACRNTGASFAARNQYRVVLLDDGTLILAKVVAGTYTQLDSIDIGTLTSGTTYTVRVEAIGTAIKTYVNGVQQQSVTDSDITTGGGLAFYISSLDVLANSSAARGWTVDAARIYNT